MFFTEWLITTPVWYQWIIFLTVIVGTINGLLKIFDRK